MSSIAIASIAFACVCAGIAIGSMLRKALPDHHIRDDSRDIVKVGTGLIATLTALVLGLLISSAKSTYDALGVGLAQGGAKIIALDRTMAQYGPQTKDARDLLRRMVASAINRWWPEDKVDQAGLAPIDVAAGVEELQHKLRALSPQNDEQRELRSQALQISSDAAMSRWQMLEQTQASLPTAFLIVLVGWQTILFASFGLFAPRNVTVFVVLLLCALSASGAIFLLLEMSHPMDGIIKVSSAPLLTALEHLGR